MADVQAAKRYAQAAFDIARDQGTIATWRAELADVASVLTDSEAAPVLADGRIPLDRRLGMVGRVLDVSPLVLNLAKLLVQKGRTSEARAVADAFDRMADEHAGIAHAEVTTAVELSPDELTAIESRLSASLGKRVRAVGTVDSAIIGGVIVRVGDQLVDGSVRSRLQRLRRELEGAHY
ncbi:MAG: ATP synthase F1 subunit delta [Dehalococcoidia bacterium]|nr:ATP synthase F1 subunit delta [Dehalococcoidia bacterium]